MGHSAPRYSPTALSRRPCAALLPLLAIALLLSAATGASAQPFGGWAIFSDSPQGYVQIPHSPALNPAAAFTFEAWVNIDSEAGCRSIAGKGWTEAWWVGVCGTTMRSYLRGSSSLRDSGTIPNNQWTHIAVTFDGAFRRHYINGEIAGQWAEAGPLTSSTDPVRIASDVSWNIIPDAAFNEVRLWSVARTTEELRQAINEPITAPEVGLIALWLSGGSPDDAVGGFDGAFVGDVFGLTFPVAFGCDGNTATSLCLDDRFIISGSWRFPDDSTGPLQVASCGNDDSGLFYYTNPNNWEILVKMLNACGINNHYWVFAASTTNVFYRMEVFDVVAGVNKIYFNYPGPPAPAITDTGAFATCP
ncbi:MAG: LamG domain-containing protein [Acidobacteriota bacterium]